MDLAIRFCFYFLFFLVPLFFYSETSELFEYNKLMLTYGLTIIIATAWSIKAVLTAQFLTLKFIKRTPFDLVIFLYLVSHLLSTIFSIDPWVSLWGFYSRFHEGFLATLSYIVLYYAFVSNLSKKDTYFCLISSLIATMVISLWGIGEHFGQSLSCYLIAPYTGGVDCWIQDVQNRVYATLGQPNWMAAYLDITILILSGILINLFLNRFLKNNDNSNSSKSKIIVTVAVFILAFTALLFTKSRSGVFAFGISIAILFLIHIYKFHQQKSLLKIPKQWLMISFSIIAFSVVLIFSLSFVFGLPFNQTSKFNLNFFLSKNQNSSPSKTDTKATTPSPYIDVLISESGDIRKVVWTGAVRVWQRYPILGSGVETFGLSYYRDRPPEHNLLSEWDFLYNKAHNEYLNILATTGTLGIITYLGLIASFFLWYGKTQFFSNNYSPIITSLFTAYLSILITNFFGFSVVIVGIYFFLIPAFCFILENNNNVETTSKTPTTTSSSTNKITIVLIFMFGVYGLYKLMIFWLADREYGLGKAYFSANYISKSLGHLEQSLLLNPYEPTFKDQLAIVKAYAATELFKESQIQTESPSQASQAAVLSQEYAKSATDLTSNVTTNHPNNVTFWKNQTKVYYQLASIDQNYLFFATKAIGHAFELAPTDARISYTLGTLLGKIGQIAPAITVLENTVHMKPDYSDARYALGILYDSTGQKQKAREQMEYMIKHIGNDDRVNQWLLENKNN